VGGGRLGCSNPPPKISKTFQNHAKLNPIVKSIKKLLNLGRKHRKMFGKKGSKILKLLPVRNCFTLAITNKLVVLKYQKLRQFYCMK